MSSHSESQAGKLNAYFDATNSFFMPALDATGLPDAERVRLKAVINPHFKDASMALLPAVFLKLHSDFNQKRLVTGLWAVVDNGEDGPYLSDKQKLLLAQMAMLTGLSQTRLVLDLPIVAEPERFMQRAARPAGQLRTWGCLPTNLTPVAAC